MIPQWTSNEQDFMRLQESSWDFKRTHHTS
jgi:hypothetical protein